MSLTVNHLSFAVKNLAGSAGKVVITAQRHRKDIPMTLMTAPAPRPPPTGAPLPMVALPQGELLTVNANDIPLIQNAPVMVCTSSRCAWTSRTASGWCWRRSRRCANSVALPHRNGRRLDHQRQLAPLRVRRSAADRRVLPLRAGIVGPHLVCPASNTEDTVVLFRVSGANVNFTDDGQFHSILDAALIAHLTGLLADEQNLGPVTYISGGAAGQITVGQIAGEA